MNLNFIKIIQNTSKRCFGHCTLICITGITKSLYKMGKTNSFFLLSHAVIYYVSVFEYLSSLKHVLENNFAFSSSILYFCLNYY